MIKAVHERDLKNFLESAGLLEAIKEGKLTCSLCGELVTIDNIVRFVVGEDVQIICDRPGCADRGKHRDE